ncbi:MAG: cation:proton antiporter [Bacteroidales bacterium]|jgi:CPA1 family monovalent cation:H+ antiporter|nr:cation:proton antiporter [Bacteroidales bacterium]
METYSIIIILLAIAIGLSPVASKIKLPYPVLLLGAGIGVGFLPEFHSISVDPNVVFLIFLPPMLYDAAYNISFKDFRTNIHTISLLAIFLIFITTTGIAITVHYLVPNMSWSLAFVVGSILSPPDAIAASGVTKGLGLPHRTATILEGESLINDASALVAFRFAVAAVTGSSFVFWNAGLTFLITLGGGLLTGLATWFVFALIKKLVRRNNAVIVSLHLMLPFVTYLLAEELHVSGVIAVVTTGLIVSMNKNRFSGQINMQVKAIWDTAIFILGGLIFILIGVEFPHILKDIPSGSVKSLIICSVLIFLIALFIRILFVFWHRWSMKRRINIISKKISATSISEETNRIDKRINRFKEVKPLSVKECIVIGWSGMRGIVSLAAALSLPLVMDNGKAFPERNTIIFLSVVTVIAMLTIQGLGLPILLKLLKINNIDRKTS